MAAVGARVEIWRAGRSRDMAGAAGSAGRGAGGGGVSGGGLVAGNLRLAKTAVSGRCRQISAAGGALRVCGRFSGPAGGDPAMRVAERGDQRRRVERVAKDSREHSTDARVDPEDA